MFMKYKQLFIGIVIGSLLFGVTPIVANTLKTFTATEATFPILVDGNIVKLDKSIVTIEGSTYLPLRAIGDILGVKVEWNTEKKQAEIYKNISNEVNNEVMEDVQIETSDISKEVEIKSKYIPSQEFIDTTPDKPIILENGIYYISFGYSQQTGIDRYHLRWSDDYEEIYAVKYGENGIEDETEIYRTKSLIVNDRIYIPYDDFVEILQPLIK